MKNLMYLFSLITITLLTSCSSLIPFTETIKKDLTEDEMKKIHFITSGKITLTLIENSKENTIEEGGVLQTKKKKEVSEVIIPKGTPGQYLFSPKEGRGAFYFDKEEGEESYSIFGPNPKVKNAYSFIAKSWERSGEGLATYKGKLWRVSSGAGLVFLSIKRQELDEITKTRKVLKGAF